MRRIAGRGLSSILLIAGGFLCALALQAIAFTEPSSNPPAGNVAAPINTGAVSQDKSDPTNHGAWITADGLGSRYGALFATISGDVGIGTTTPQAKLDVNGSIHPGSATTGASCAGNPEGSFAYDTTAHAPVYCASSGNWTAIGGAQSGTLCGWLYYNPVGSPYTYYVSGTACAGGTPSLPYYTNTYRDYVCPSGYSLVNIQTNAASTLGSNFSCAKT